MKVETMSAFACHVMAPRLTRSGGDGDKPIITINLLTTGANSHVQIGQWARRFCGDLSLALLMTVTDLILRLRATTRPEVHKLRCTRATLYTTVDVVTR